MLDEELPDSRNRELGRGRYLILDARYEKIRHVGTVRDCAELLAIGILPDGSPAIVMRDANKLAKRAFPARSGNAAAPSAP